MIHFKLNAINSTNSFLREMSKNEDLQNWTVVSTDYQTDGRGQKGAVWQSEVAKNLMCSILVQLNNFPAQDQFLINCAVSVGIYKALLKYKLTKLKIKWPNDIMSVSRKLGGILIENTVMNGRINRSIIGVGINVNQESFAADIPRAVSMRQLTGIELDREPLLEAILKSIQEQFVLIAQKNFKELKKTYESCLYRINKPHMYQDSNNIKFMGIIRGVNEQGMLMIERQNGSIDSFNFKEVVYL